MPKDETKVISAHCRLLTFQLQKIQKKMKQKLQMHIVGCSPSCFSPSPTSSPLWRSTSRTPIFPLLLLLTTFSQVFELVFFAISISTYLRPIVHPSQQHKTQVFLKIKIFFISSDILGDAAFLISAGGISNTLGR